MRTFKVQGAGVTGICEEGLTMWGLIQDMVERGGTPTYKEVTMARERGTICGELAAALKVWDKMNDDLAAMRYTGTKAEHNLQRQKIDSLVRELESLDQKKAS